MKTAIWIAVAIIMFLLGSLVGYMEKDVELKERDDRIIALEVERDAFKLEKEMIETEKNILLDFIRMKIMHEGVIPRV